MPFRWSISAPVSLDQLRTIEDAASRILECVGIEVGNTWLKSTLAARGYSTDAAGRIRVPRGEAQGFLEALRQRHGNTFTPEPQPPPAESAPPRITLDPSSYALHLHDADTDAITPLTVAGQIQALHLVYALRHDAVISTWVGQPSDVPPPLRPLIQYWLAGRYLPDLRLDNLLQSPATLPFELDMAEALGKPIRGAVVFCFSPLRLAGESVDCAIAARSRFATVWVGNMAGVGSTASIHPGDAYALAVAETLGSAILLQAALGLPTDFGVSLYPADLRTLMQTFASPEAYLLQLMTPEVNAFLHGCPWRAGTSDLHIGACLPGPQAAAEKMAILVPSALLGIRHFSGAGILGTDEIFSPEQLLYDMEMRDHACRLAAGWDAACDSERSLADVLAAGESHTFAALDSTVATHRASYWTPTLFSRGAIGHWRARGARCDRDAAHARLCELRSTPSYVAPPERCRELDRILARAQTALGTCYRPPDTGT